MPDKVFLDSNILIYAFSETEPDKRDVARKLWRRPPILSVQPCTPNREYAGDTVGRT